MHYAVSLEDKLSGWTGLSSQTEQDKQERTERMIRQAVDNHPAFKNCSLSVFAKGSYANNQLGQRDRPGSNPVTHPSVWAGQRPPTRYQAEGACFSASGFGSGDALTSG
jgi:hypothetical protein